MLRLNRLLIMALAAAMFASFTVGQVGTVSAQEVPPTGVVVEYLPGQSITIVDQSGTQHQYTISSTIKILPPGRANSLAVGSFVTIIAPASLSQGKQMAVGIVVHPQVRPGWSVPSISATPLMTSTALETSTASPTSLATETATATETPTGMQLATDTATATATGTQLATDTATATETPTALGTSTDTPIGGGTTISTNALIEWLRSLFQQILTSR
jgi:hypothetical protein